jgi:two-component system phosphate regulon sensor histidine kinase PhoR
MRRRLFVFFVIILFFGITITGYLSYNFTKNLILNNTRDELKTADKIAEDYLERPSNYADLNSAAEHLKFLTGNRITIIDVNGKVVGETDAASSIMENHLGRPEIKDAFSKGEGTAIRYSDTEKRSLIYSAKRVYINNDAYVIRASVELDDIKKIQLNYLRLIIIAIIVGMIIVSILVYIYLNIFTQPIRMLTRVATTISLGEYDKRINVTSNDEIGQLGNAFNLMAGRLQETILDLSDKRNKLVAILTSMDDGVIVVDKNERILLINPSAQRIFNINGNVEGKHFIEVVRNNEIEDIIKNVTCEDIEIPLEYPHPMTLRVKSTKVSEGEKDGKDIGILLFIEDVTKIKMLEKIRSDFVANVSHELKTPLTSIKGFAETLKYVDEKGTRDKFLDIIYIESERLTRLINDILTLSELENKDYLANFEKVDVKNSIEEVIHIMEPVARGKKICILKNMCDEDIFIYGDSDKFKQMLINLVDNSVKYTNENGHIEVILYSEDSMACISVKDNGIGIARESIPRLFERFYRVDKARSRSMGGTGLGLAIVKHISVLLNAEISVDSKIGEGTTFTIRIPIVKQTI